MLSVGRKVLCSGRSRLLWRQYSLVKPVVRVVDIILNGQKRDHMHVPSAAAAGTNWLHWRKIHSCPGLLGKVVSFLMPDVGEGIQTVEMKEWLVKVGDRVTMGDAICEVQSDKAAATIYVSYDGVVKELMYEVGDVATKGEPLLTVELGEKEEKAPPTPSPSPATLTTDKDKMEPVKGIRVVMARTMTASGRTPQFGYCDEVDMTNLVNLRSLVREELLERGIRFSYMPVIVKAVSMALHHYPILNSHTDPECTMVTYKADHNIGVAMDTPKGLVVPNIKQCQLKSVLEIAVELNRIHELGLENKLTPNDMVAGTFSLSNIGAIGGTYTKPMLLPPEVAIGGLGKIKVLPRFDSAGSLKKAHIMHVSWSADHRVIEGATIARFSNLWKSYLESPEILINTDLK